LLERNRWNGKGPSFLVSEWMEYIAEAGFKGVELWAPHLLLASRSEWEAIREKSGESELPVARLFAQLPVDAGDKSRRVREALIEAAEYFDYPEIRFTLPESGSASEKLAFLEHWTEAMPREIRLVRVFEAGSEVGDAEAWHQRLQARLSASANPFLLERESVERLSDVFEGKLVNINVRVLKGAQTKALRDAAELPGLVALLRRVNFQGSWTLESTRGAGAPGENIDDLFDSAEEDLNFLVEELGKK
jgi:hypothetical protein